jgi:DNA-binding beta-propeller fold protein YncE
MTLSVVLSAALLIASQANTTGSAVYSFVKSIPIGAPDRWDYLVSDDHSHRVYFAHRDRLVAVDAKTLNVVGEVRGVSRGAHGIALSNATHRGFTDDGENGMAIIFDLDTLRVTREARAAVEADAVAYDPVSEELFIVEGVSQTISVIDAMTGATLGTINAGEDLEYAAADGAGHIYAAGEGNGDVLKIAARSRKITARWPLPGCKSPHGLALDRRGRRLFVGCANAVMMVVDPGIGQVVSKLKIGRGSDAIAFDPVRKRVFSPNGLDGTITAYQQISPNRYLALPLIRTAVSARTMTVDAGTGRLFVAGADTYPDPAGGYPKVQPGTLRLMVFEPKP